MAYAVVMVHVDVDETSDGRIRLAADFAKRFGSTLIGVGGCLLPAYAAETGYYVNQEFIEQERAAIAALLQKREAAFREMAARNAAKVEWRADLALPDDMVAREARAADILIVGRMPGDGGIARAVDPARAVLRAGRPVLVVPPGIDKLTAKSIVVGWKDTREARRALADALPLLHEANGVRLLEVCDRDSAARAREDLADVARYLTRHRIVADTSVVTDTDKIGDALLRAANEDGADLIVAGAYGRSRLGEWAFGGATRDLLIGSPVCLLLSH